MPVKKDGTGKRWVEMEFLTPGTPEQVWQAMATGSGNAAWFTKAVIEEHVGGVLQFDFGPAGNSSGEVTMWEPPYRFGYVERDWSEDAPPVVTEITIASRSESQCIVRMIHSLSSESDTWDEQLENFENGWPAFFDILRTYLAHFAGKRAASFMVVSNAQGDHLAIWKRYIDRLGLVSADVGETRSLAHPESLTCVVEGIHQDEKQRFIRLRLTTPVPGILLAGTYDTDPKVSVSASLFLYGDDAEKLVAASERKWREWIGETFPAS